MQAVNWQAPLCTAEQQLMSCINSFGAGSCSIQSMLNSLSLLSFEMLHIGLEISGRVVTCTALHHIIVSLMSAMYAQQQRAASEKIAKVVLYLKHSRIHLFLEPREAVAWVGLTITMTGETQFWAKGSMRSSGSQRLKGTKVDSSLVSSYEQEHLRRTVSFYLGPTWTLTCLGESRWCVLLSCSFLRSKVAMETHTIFPITGPLIVLT